MRALGPALLAASLLGGCMPDLEALRGAEPGDEDGGWLVTLADGGVEADGFDAGTPSAREVGTSADPDASPESPDGAEPPLPACGVPGTPCCREGTGAACPIGACLRGGCEAFVGLWARPEPLGCVAGGCMARNPFTAGCSCPTGFETFELGPLGGPCGGGGASSGASMTLRLCLGSGRLPRSAFGGAWLRAGARCLVPDRWLGRCACPEGTEALRLPTRLPDGTEALLGLCVGPGVGEEVFAGAYRLGPASGSGCEAPNPLTGACTCPAGSREQWIPLRTPAGVGAPVALCLRDGA